jgi:hypothetical protein
MTYLDWNTWTQVFMLLGYSAAMLYFGYLYGQDDAKWQAEKTANLNRVKLAQDKQLYDWEKHGL